MAGRAQPAVAAFVRVLAFTLSWMVVTTAASSAGVRVDEPGPPRSPRPPRIPLPTDYLRDASLQVAMGPSDVSALGFAGGGFVEQAVYERVHSPRSSWIVRVSHTDAEELQFRGARTQDLRDGRIRDIRAARVDALEIGIRANSRGPSVFYVEAGAGLSRTRLDGVAVLSMPEFAFLLERRVALQSIGGVDVGHVWQPVRFPLGVLAEIGWHARGAPLAGSQISAKIGLLGQHASP